MSISSLLSNNEYNLKANSLILENDLVVKGTITNNDLIETIFSLSTRIKKLEDKLDRVTKNAKSTFNSLREVSDAINNDPEFHKSIDSRLDFIEEQLLDKIQTVSDGVSNLYSGFVVQQINENNEVTSIDYNGIEQQVQVPVGVQPP